MIERTYQVLLQKRVVALQVANDLRAQAAALRDVRNYSAHPVGEVDEDREAAFTEAGCLTLFVSARRYFIRLDGARQTLSELTADDDQKG